MIETDPYEIFGPILAPELPPQFETMRDFKLTLYAEQRGLCGLCKRTIPFGNMIVEHDHQTGKVRSLVCARCNTNIIGANTPGSASDLILYMNYPPAWNHYASDEDA
jgi:hypothetical protein